MTEFLTLDEMEVKYEGNWVLIGDPVFDEQSQLRGGRVLFFSPDRDQLTRKLDECPQGHYGIRCFVTPPEGMVFVL